MMTNPCSYGALGGPEGALHRSLAAIIMIGCHIICIASFIQTGQVGTRLPSLKRRLSEKVCEYLWYSRPTHIISFFLCVAGL